MSDRRSRREGWSQPGGARPAQGGPIGLARAIYTGIVNWSARPRNVRHALGHNFALAFHAGNLALATLANSALGFVYWWVLARVFTPTNVGLASADISLLILLSMAAEVGLGTLLQGEIPQRQRTVPHLVSAALFASVACAGVVGLAYLALVSALAPAVGGAGSVFDTRLLLVVGIVVQTGSSVLDSALIGMLRGPLRLLRNLLFSGAKLTLVIGAAALAIPKHWQLSAIVASWLVGQALASLGLAAIIRLRGKPIWYRPNFDLLRRLAGVAVWHHLLNFVATVPSLLLPVIIALMLSPEQTAPFYAAWMMLTLAGIAPTALATVLFSVGSSGSSQADSNIRFSLFVSLGIGALAAVGFSLLSDVALNVLNPVYSHLVGSDLRLLGLSIPLIAIKVHYVTLQRLEHRVRVATFALGVLGAIEILFAILGAKYAGLEGVVAGWLIAMGFETACLWPTIWRRLGGEGIGPWRRIDGTGGQRAARTRRGDGARQPTDASAVAVTGPVDSSSDAYRPPASDIVWLMAATKGGSRDE